MKYFLGNLKCNTIKMTQNALLGFMIYFTMNMYHTL